MTNDFHAPDVPPHLVKCLNQQTPAGDGSADALVTNAIRTDEERRACSIALLRWYEGIKQAQRSAAQ